MKNLGWFAGTWVGLLNVIEKDKDRAMLLQLLQGFLIEWDSYVECSVLKVDLVAFVGIFYGSGSNWGPWTP